MATATKESPVSSEVVNVAALLGDKDTSLKELLATVEPIHIARAWAAGDIEFGHVDYVTSGKVGRERSTMYVELKMVWTGPKQRHHQGFGAIQEEATNLPRCEFYRKYVKSTDEKTKEDIFRAIEISEEEAHGLIAYRVRATDKGLAGSAGSVA